jgi:pyruvate dehydrogenase E2 component (dihydrolipoamide acetyltransferase)
VQSVHSDFREQEVKTTTQAERLEREAEEATARSKAAAGKKAKAKAQGISKNADNPVYIGNAVIAAAVGAGLGYGAYRKHTDGKLSWEVAGIWAGAVGLFAGVDYFVSKYVFSSFLYS